MTQMKRVIGIDAVNAKQGMTLRELAYFVQTAFRADLPQDTVVKAGVGWSQQLQKIKVEAFIDIGEEKA